MSKLRKQPLAGMKDILPCEMRIRNMCLQIIKDTYKTYGFEQIETPCMESVENLSSKSGGENEKLVFEILNRGSRLKPETGKREDLTTDGLRYDLTLPLVRYYANNENDLPNPFKSIQIGPVWRADRPQKGRFRQFMQCDIDVIGDASNMSEIDLILATTTVFGKLDFKNVNVRINDRRILKAISTYCGFNDEVFDDFCIILDKMDKISLSGVGNELLNSGFDTKCTEKLINLFKMLETSKNKLEDLTEKIKDYIDEDVFNNLNEIIDAVNSVKVYDFTLSFDPALIRGMNYYTGPIFEISLPDFGSSCGGGGRYDKMIGKFLGKEVPACGFSIGFERLVMLLMEREEEIIAEEDIKYAFVVEKTIKEQKLQEIFKEAQNLRNEGTQVLITKMTKNKKLQKEKLTNDGYVVKEFFENPIQN